MTFRGLSNKTTGSSGTGSFTSKITGLAASTPYYVRAYFTKVRHPYSANDIIAALIQEWRGCQEGNQNAICEPLLAFPSFFA